MCVRHARHVSLTLTLNYGHRPLQQLIFFLAQHSLYGMVRDHCQI